MASKKSIEIKVAYHISGNLTLQERNLGEPIFKDVRKPNLWKNSDALAFYRAVARRIAKHAKNGIMVAKYTDTTLIGLQIMP